MSIIRTASEELFLLSFLLLLSVWKKSNSDQPPGIKWKFIFIVSGKVGDSNLGFAMILNIPLWCVYLNGNGIRDVLDVNTNNNKNE